MPTLKPIRCMLIFGGGGLVGYQVARQAARQFAPERIVCMSLYKNEAVEAIKKLRKEFSNIQFDYEYGNMFVREDYSEYSRGELLESPTRLSQIYQDVFGKLTEDSTDEDNIGNQNLMIKIIRKHRPDAIVDCVNTATAISYQDTKSSAVVVKRFRDELENLLSIEYSEDFFEKAESGDKEAVSELVSLFKNMRSLTKSPIPGLSGINNLKMIDILLISLAVPQLVRHILLLYNVLVEVGTQVYVKVGTTGTGGMGINIPYTHGEDKPSYTLMAKSSVGFAHTGLLFLLARSPGPIIKEIKPGAMIGYKKVECKSIKKFGRKMYRWESKKEVLGDKLELRHNLADYRKMDKLKLVGIDTGENGFFSRGEFEAISFLNQMEFVTPEEIARNVIYEIIGASTGKDVIAAIDGAIMDPSYRAGYLRQSAIDKMRSLEEEIGVPSVAIGELGPPQLSKLLYEAYLLKTQFNTLKDAVEDKELTPDRMSEILESYVLDNGIQEIMTSLGLPILLRDGKTILRGPTIYIPESKVDPIAFIRSEDDIDKWAKRGWIDLRSSNMSVWKERFRKMMETEMRFRREGSAEFDAETYLHETIHMGDVVGWIFNNEFGELRIM